MVQTNKDSQRYPSDVSDEEWAFVAPYLTLMTEDAPQRVYPLREVFNSLRYIAKAGSQWRMMPKDLPPWHVVYQQTQRWVKAKEPIPSSNWYSDEIKNSRTNHQYRAHNHLAI